MIIEQPIEIPADHRLTIEVPPEIPAGKAIITYSPEHVRAGLFARIRAFLHDHSPFRSAFSKHFYEFYGCAKGSGVFEDDAVNIVREWRDEWTDPWERGAGTDGKAVSNGKA